MIKRKKISSCGVCGKPLSDSISVALGTGPICRLNHKLQNMNNGNLFAQRAEYSYDIERNILWIEDKGGLKSVTNDIENILTDISYEQDISNKKIMYKDTDGIWDGIKSNITKTKNGTILVERIEFFSYNRNRFQKSQRKIIVEIM